ncbi:MAG: hypothetical protein R3C59_28675 [Planctomycetaceae bacterium]
MWTRTLIPTLWLLVCAARVCAQVPTCMSVDRYFVDEVWAKVGELTCLKCHRADGDAADSDFVLTAATADSGHLRHNYAEFARLMRKQQNDASLLLTKVSGGLDHGGGEVLKPDSAALKILQQFERRLRQADSPVPPDQLNSLAEAKAAPFFEGVSLVSSERLLRRVTLSLAARLPTEDELAAVANPDAIDGILDRIMTEDAFYERLKEGFNDIFLTLGYDGNGDDALSYDHFEKTRHWYQKHDLSHLPEKDQQKARWKLADVYRDALRREPLELIAYIVRNDRPFTELVTADYIMVSPYTSRGYGLFESLRHEFENPDDPFEFIPARLPALISRNGRVQESPTGFYPHAGILSTFQYLRRYPTTPTNRNRLRARMYYQHFLGIDVMELAPRVTDAAALTAKFEVPTMQAVDCVVCHKSIDPLAGLFQDFNEDGHLGPRKEGWYSDMFGPGREHESLTERDRWRALAWLGERTAEDSRFAVAMVEHVYYLLMGRKVLPPEQDIVDPDFAARRMAYIEQRRVIEDVAQHFREANFNLKVIFRQLVKSTFYQVDGDSIIDATPQRMAALHDVGIARLLTPEQLERRLAAVFGDHWGRLAQSDERFSILYGGIDSKSVTERGTDPSGAMGAIQRMMANDMACRHVARDFSKPPNERLLFPSIEPTVVPGQKNAEQKIRAAIVHLHQRLLGHQHQIDHPEVNRTYSLFAGLVDDARRTDGVEKSGTYFCERINEQRLPDPDYTLRAWRGVVTYLLRQHDFLYE